MHSLKNIVSQASMIGRYFADKGEPEMVRQQFALLRSVADLETAGGESCSTELCYAAIYGQEEALVHLACQNVSRNDAVDTEGEDKCANWKPLGDEHESVASC